jgi:anti-sigma factor RsiW
MSSPQCREIRTELGAYVLGLLDAADEQRVREHLDRCADCATEVASLRETGSALSLTDLEMVEGPPEPSP